MKKEKIREDRRKILRTALEFSVLYPFFGCQSSKDDSKDSKTPAKGSYVPSVNSNPYPDMDYSVGQELQKHLEKL